MSGHSRSAQGRNRGGHRGGRQSNSSQAEQAYTPSTDGEPRVERFDYWSENDTSRLLATNQGIKVMPSWFL